MDELIFVPGRKYGIPLEVTLEFVDSIVRPYIAITPVEEEEFEEACKAIREHRLRPSDAIHVGTMRANGISVIASEDREFDGVPSIRRVWLDSAGSAT